MTEVIVKPNNRQLHRARLRHQKRILDSTRIGDELFAHTVADVLEVRAEMAIDPDAIMILSH